MADIPLASKKHNLLHVPHIAFNVEWDTILYVSNPNGLPVDVNIEVINSDGNAVLNSIRSVNPYGSFETGLSELLSGQSLTGGKMKLSSSTGVAAFALYHNLKTGYRNFAGINAVDPYLGTGESGSIVGAWGEEIFAKEGYGCLVLYSDGKFIDFFSNSGGVEYGTYTFDPMTGFLGKHILRDDNGENGLSDNGNPYTDIVTVVGDYIIAEHPDDSEDPERKTVVKRVFDDESPIVGGWMLPGNSGGYNAMVFYSDGKYFHYESETGAEYGTYAHNNATGSLIKTVVYDENGASGLADNGSPYNDQVFVTGDVLSIKDLDEPADSAVAHRVR
jgi:hypothetical protein